MAEGLNPIEAGMKLHEHVEAHGNGAKKRAATPSPTTELPATCRNLATAMDDAVGAEDEESA